MPDDSSFDRPVRDERHLRPVRRIPAENPVQGHPVWSARGRRGRASTGAGCGRDARAPGGMPPGWAAGVWPATRHASTPCRSRPL